MLNVDQLNVTGGEKEPRKAIPNIRTIVKKKLKKNREGGGKKERVQKENNEALELKPKRYYGGTRDRNYRKVLT